MSPIEIYILGALGYSLVEYWLGKTDKVKPGSVLEAGLLGAKAVLGVAIKRRLK
jgi:hypothetical protein